MTTTTSPEPSPTGARAAKRVPKGATVVAVEEVAEDMVRLRARVDDPSQIPDLTFTDHYVKVLLTPPGAGYRWPFDPEEVRRSRPRAQWPLTRTYTVRTYDADRGVMTLDLLVHEGGGAAQPWIRSLRVGEVFGFLGPGGKWRPGPALSHHLLVGDASALPAIAASMEVLGAGSRAEVFVEVAGPGSRVGLPDLAGAEVTWVHTGDALPGSRLVRTVIDAHPDLGDTDVFLHGNAEMVRDLRRHLVGERGLDRAMLSASGYWRHGCTDEEWRAQKRDFDAEFREVAAEGAGGPAGA